LVLSERKITHSASFRATGSEILASAALASASLPLRVASITRFTAAMSAAEVAAVCAIAKGPETGRASGLIMARLSNSAPCGPTLACANAERPPLLAAGRFCGSGAAFCASGVTAGTGACLTVLMAGRGRGKGTFCSVAANAPVHRLHVAANAK
jgi:hypothetical protein